MKIFKKNKVNYLFHISSINRVLMFLLGLLMSSHVDLLAVPTIHETKKASYDTLDEQVHYSDYVHRHAIARLLSYYKNKKLNLSQIQKSMQDLQSRSAAKYYFEASLALHQEQYDIALYFLDKSILLNNTYSFSWALRSTVWIKLEKDYLKAVSDIQRALNLNPYESSYAFMLANYYWHLKEYALTMQYCNQALTLRENFSEAYLLRAQVFEQKNDITRALDDYLLAHYYGIKGTQILQTIERVQHILFHTKKNKY